MKTIAGALLFACSKRSLTLEAPTPTNISTKSAPLILKKGTFDSPATALANSVFPVPGGPTNKTPLGIFPPSFSNFFGLFKYAMTSSSSSLASMQPATSLNFTFFCLPEKIFALLFPKLKTLFIPLPEPCILLKRNNQNAISNNQGAKPNNHPVQSIFSPSKLYSIFFSSQTEICSE